MHSFDNLLTPFDPNGPNVPPPPSVEETLRAAGGIKFPDDLAKRKKAYSEASLKEFKANIAANPNMPLPYIIEIGDGKTSTYTRAETIAAMEREPHDPPLGEWPASSGPSGGLSVAYNILTGEPLPKVYIGLAPTDDWTTIPAYLRWGGWNDCPAAEYHVAAMRTWRDRYGLELIGMSFDTINLRVAAKPKTREEALALARDQYIYCADIIDQGVQTYSRSPPISWRTTGGISGGIEDTPLSAVNESSNLGGASAALHMLDERPQLRQHLALARVVEKNAGRRHGKARQ
jgi:Domain of unknown function (DUF4253)